MLCSPDAARSHWTNAEIELFKRNRPEGCVLAAIASGEPFASEIPGREDEECFPPALRQRFDRRGRPTGKRAEPLAADLRDSGDGRRPEWQAARTAVTELMERYAAGRRQVGSIRAPAGSPVGAPSANSSS